MAERVVSTGWAVDNLYSDMGAGDRATQAAQIAPKKEKPKLTEVVKSAWDQESSVAGLMHVFGRPDFVPDYGYNPLEDNEWKELTEDIPPQYHSLFLDSTSGAHARHKKQQILQELKNEENLSSGLGLTARLGAAFLDPGAWALSLATGGAFTLSKASRLARFAQGGAVVAAENAALEAFLNSSQEVRDQSDVAYAAALGFGLGGSLSALLKPRDVERIKGASKELVERSNAAYVRNADDPNVSLTPEGEELLAAPTPARVLSIEDIKRKLDEDAEAAKQEVLADIRAKGEAGMPEPVIPVKAKRLSDVDRAKLQARVDREEALWQQRKADEEAAKVDADIEAQKIKNTEPHLEGAMASALRPVKEKMQRTSVWDQIEEDLMGKKRAEEEAAYAQRQLQLAEQQSAQPVPEGAADELVPAKVPEEEPLEVVEAGFKSADEALDAAEQMGAKGQATGDNPKVEPEDDILVAAGDNITVELPDGRLVAGRVKSFNEETGIAVIMDDATDKPVRVNLNEVQVDEVMVNDNTFERGGFIPEGSIGSGQILPIEVSDNPLDMVDDTDTAFNYFKIPLTNIKVPLRYDYYATLLRSQLGGVRALTKVLMADAVGNVNHSGRGLNASELASIDWHKFKGQFFVTARQSYDEYAKSKGWGLIDKMKNEEEFYKNLTRAVRDNSTNQYTDPHIGKAVIEIQRIHNQMLELAKKHGVKGAEEVLPDPFYMMRRFNHDKIVQLNQRFGQDQLEKLVAGAIRSVRPVSPEDAARIARQYVTVVRAIPYKDMHQLRLGDAGRDRLREIARKLGIDDADTEMLMDMVLQKPGKVEGDTGRLKSKTILNENFKMKLIDMDGKGVDVSMEDFFENDSRILMDLYTRQMSGRIGLAKMGIRSDADFEKLLDDVDTEAMTGGYANTPRLQKEKQWLRDVYNNIIGNPMHDEVYGTSERIAKALRDFNFIRMMGQVGFAQAAEIGNTLGYAGWRAMSKHMPALREVMKMAKSGQMDDQLARDLINMGGLGAEMASMHPMMRHADDMMYNAGLTKAEAALAHGRHAVAMVSGLAPITNMLRQVSSRAFVQKFSDYARGLDKMAKGDIDRLAWAGIGKDNIKAVFRDLKKFSKVEGRTSKVESIDWEKWQAASPDTYETFRMAIWRESRRVVQEQTIGETAPWMHTHIGKILTQFRGFMLVAHGKQTLYGLHHRDLTVANAFIASTLFAGMSYVAQNAINFAGNQEELEKRLAWDAIAKSAFQRNSASALIPATVDTLAGFAGWDTVFKYGRSTGLASSVILGNPTVDLLFNKMGGTASNVTQMFTTDDHTWREQDVKNAINLVVPNLLGVKTLLEAWSDQFPTVNPLREYNEQ